MEKPIRKESASGYDHLLWQGPKLSGFVFWQQNYPQVRGHNREERRYDSEKSVFKQQHRWFLTRYRWIFQILKHLTIRFVKLAMLFTRFYRNTGAYLQRSKSSDKRRFSKQAAETFKIIFPLCETIFPAMSIKRLRTVVAYAPIGTTGTPTSSLKDSIKKWPSNIE